MGLSIFEVVSGNPRALFHASFYFVIGMIGIAIFLYLVMGWRLIESLLLGSIVSQTGAVVIVPMAKKLGTRDDTAVLLSLEATMTSVFNIVFFFAFLETSTGGILDIGEALTFIFLKFSVGLLIGAVMGLLWLRALLFFEKEELTYIASVGYLLLAYVVSEILGGSGALTVLALGVVLGNGDELFRILGIRLDPLAFATANAYLIRFQGEISFILRTFFFVLLGLMFDISQSSLFLGAIYGLPITGILLVIRYLITSISTQKNPMSSDRGIIVGMCALGLTPALLSFVSMQYNLPDASRYTFIVTNVIIITNIIISIKALAYRRSKIKSP